MTFIPHNPKFQLYKLASIITCAAMISACGSGSSKSTPAPQNNPDVAPTPTITTIASDDERFDSLQLALETTDLDEVLNDRTKTFTVFAPTDDAFDKLGDELNALLNDPEGLANILKYHVVNGTALDSTTAISFAGTTMSMLSGDKVAVSLQDGKLFINNAEVIVTDIAAANGTIHAIDTVITQPKQTVEEGLTVQEVLFADMDLTELYSDLQAADLAYSLNMKDKKFTVFAPTNAAFEQIPAEQLAELRADVDELKNVLSYHVLADQAVDWITALTLTGAEPSMLNGDSVAVKYMDGQLYINGSKVVTTDIVTDNGIIHKIDTVLTPPIGTIVDVATEDKDDRFSTLVNALKVAELDSVLADKNAMFTVFAPTNDAFDKIPEDELKALLEDKYKLKNVLLYHVIAGSKINSTMATDAVGGSKETANKANVNLSLNGDDQLLVNDSLVVAADVTADNGIIHAIDTVMFPPGNIVDLAIEAKVFESFSAALMAAGLDTFNRPTEVVLNETGLKSVLADAGGSFTVFMPTEAAFTALGSEVLSTLASNPEKLKAILLYHVVKGSKIDSIAAQAAIMEAAAQDDPVDAKLTMADDNEVVIKLDGDTLMIGDANVVTTNTQASNGVIHFIDKVIMPPEVEDDMMGGDMMEPQGEM